MTFFNKKEDVLDIELTQFGKYLLSQGEFEPVYYAFYDDEIIYDAQYCGISAETGSNQNLAEARIKEVPRPKAQHVFSGLEEKIKQNNKLIKYGELIDDGKAVFVGKKDPNLKYFNQRMIGILPLMRRLGNQASPQIKCQLGVCQHIILSLAV